MTSVVLIGGGRIGLLVRARLEEVGGFELLGTYDASNAAELDGAAPAADLAIDFSNKAALPHVLAYVRRTGAALLSGTTGFSDAELDELRALGEATRVVRLPKALYHYRMREGSITASWDPQLTRDWTRAADDREEYIVHRFPELKGFMTLQQLNFFANLDYETMRQSLIAGLKIDPEDADALRRRIEGLTKSADEGDEPVPETLRELLGLLKLGITKVADGTFGKADGSGTDGDAENDDVTLADRFRDMREDWRQLRIQRGAKLLPGHIQYSNTRSVRFVASRFTFTPSGRDIVGMICPH